MLDIFLVNGIAYVVGAIPVGYCIARICGIDNITTQGSGNIGATNVARLLGARFFLLVFFLDALKAWAVIFWIKGVGCSPCVISIASASLLVGNGCSLFLRGKGGKGVATAAGIYAAIQPHLFFVFGLVWGASLFITKTAGVASLVTMLVMPVVTYFSMPPFIALSCAISCWVIYRHKNNFQKMLGKK